MDIAILDLTKYFMNFPQLLINNLHISCSATE
jgi:hypothetical protein